MANNTALGKPSATGQVGKPRSRPEKVVVRSYPKIVLRYPTWIAAILAGILMSWLETAKGHKQDLSGGPAASAEYGDEGNVHKGAEAIARDWRIGFWFLLIVGLNLIVLAFDFPRTTSLTLVFCIVAIVFGALWINYKHQFLPILNEWVHALNPFADATFYWTVVGILLVIYIFVFIDTRFDYWEIMPNEIIHHLGILGNVNRYPAPQLKLEKEITDVFEFFLLRSGRLLLHPSTERRAIVLETVPNINRREDDIQALLRVLDVHVHQDVEMPSEH
ncbi:MAG: hypothetical protein HY000_38975 [Planctomycetes bacterium]|nr:hypothetical protein [Planctomycetota bacterium]